MPIISLLKEEPMHRTLVVIGLCAALLLIAAPVQAITYGEPDGAGHPYVGGLVATNPSPVDTWLYCSGTLISPTVFLTAAHCIEEGTALVTVTFDPDYQPGDQTYT